MKILKSGEKGLVFKCPFCGCKFKALASECKREMGTFYYYFYANCPECELELRQIREI